MVLILRIVEYINIRKYKRESAVTLKITEQ